MPYNDFGTMRITGSSSSGTRAKKSSTSSTASRSSSNSLRNPATYSNMASRSSNSGNRPHPLRAGSNSAMMKRAPLVRRRRNAQTARQNKPHPMRKRR